MKQDYINFFVTGTFKILFNRLKNKLHIQFNRYEQKYKTFTLNTYQKGTAM
jgi:hypothetical protein